MRYKDSNICLKKCRAISFGFETYEGKNEYKKKNSWHENVRFES